MSPQPPPGPLFAASLRLRGRPGRPRKNEPEGEANAARVAARETVARAQTSITARLLTLEATAAYLSVSPWTVRDLEAAGVLRRVCVPLPGGRDLRKLLFDRADLDRLIESWK